MNQNTIKIVIDTQQNVNSLLNSLWYVCVTKDNRQIQAEWEEEKKRVSTDHMMTNRLSNFQIYDLMNLGVS